MRYYIDNGFTGPSNFEFQGERVQFIPFPEEANSQSYGYTLNEELNDEIQFGETIEIFHLALDEKVNEQRTTGWGTRKFFLLIDKKEIE